MQRILRVGICLLLAGIAPGLFAAADPYDYDRVALDLFWNRLYNGGGWTLYCGFRFDPGEMSPEGYAIEIDHVYSTEWIMAHLQCRNRKQCYAESGEKFRRMEADMHNLYPAWPAIVTHRVGRIFGSVDGADSRFDSCDFKWKAGFVEPRTIAAGNIARAIFYMHTRYDLPVDPAMLATLKQWNRMDPPSRQEYVRNDLIEQIQGTRNPYIDNPELADELPPLTASHDQGSRESISEKKPSDGS